MVKPTPRKRLRADARKFSAFVFLTDLLTAVTRERVQCGGLKKTKAPYSRRCYAEIDLVALSFFRRSRVGKGEGSQFHYELSFTAKTALVAMPYADCRT